MEELTVLIDRKLTELRDELNRLEKMYSSDDGCFLEIKRNKGKYTQFYKCKMISDGKMVKVKREFIRKDDIVIAKQLAQKDFDLQLLKQLRGKIAALETVLQNYSEYDERKLFADLSDDRRGLVETKYKDDDSYIAEWEDAFSINIDNMFNSKYPIETSYFTDKGEHVRSKSEKIIADKFAKENIPYVYEPGCDLNKKALHPDFALLNIDTRETFYYEHFGMMDKPEYATAAVRKIVKYRTLGYEYGKNLLYTFETGTDGLDIKDLCWIISNYLK